MDNNQKITYTKNCLEFLDYKCVTSDNKDFRIYEGKNDNLPNIIDANFNDGFLKNWNWIHEIVESIEKLNYYTKNECIRNVNYFNIYELENNEVTFYGTSNSKKEAVVEAIDKFLKWHKQNKH